jgi:hypothetical protein
MAKQTKATKNKRPWVHSLASKQKQNNNKKKKDKNQTNEKHSKIDKYKDENRSSTISQLNQFNNIWCVFR